MAKQDHDTSNSEARGYFHDRVVLVTGASSGIGRDIAIRFSEMGAKAALLARRKPLLDELAHEIESHGGSALVLRADVTKRTETHGATVRSRTSVESMSWERYSSSGLGSEAGGEGGALGTEFVVRQTT